MINNTSRNKTVANKKITDDKKIREKINQFYNFRENWHIINKLKYHYIDEGENQVVVMVHGNPTWSFFYRDMVNKLKDNYRCIVPDHMGCGLSDKPQDYDYTLKKHIDNLEVLIEDLLPKNENVKINMIVHDWGGPIGLGYITRHPERINKLVVLNTSVFLRGELPKIIMRCRNWLIGNILIRGLNLFAKMATKKTTVKPMSKELCQAFIAPYDSWKNRIAIKKFVDDIPVNFEVPSHAEFEKILLNLKENLQNVPVLIQWGMNDWCFDKQFLNMWKKALPDAEVDTYNAGHYLLEDAGEKIAEKIKKFFEESK